MKKIINVEMLDGLVAIEDVDADVIASLSWVRVCKAELKSAVEAHVAVEKVTCSMPHVGMFAAFFTSDLHETIAKASYKVASKKAELDRAISLLEHRLNKSVNYEGSDEEEENTEDF